MGDIAGTPLVTWPAAGISSAANKWALCSPLPGSQLAFFAGVHTRSKWVGAGRPGLPTLIMTPRGEGSHFGGIGLVSPVG